MLRVTVRVAGVVLMPALLGAITITTTPGPAVVLGSGMSLVDSALLAGGLNPTGTITFELFNPGSVLIDTETVSVNGNGTYSTPTGFAPPGVGALTGTYEWTAAYSGDSNNSAASSPFGDEPEVVSPASPNLSTTPGAGVMPGGVLSDSAVLSGGYNPTGTITFQLFNPGSALVDTEIVSVSGNGTYSTPTGFVSTSPGAYQWQASYSGDGGNLAVGTPLGEEPEIVTPEPGSLAIAGLGLIVGLALWTKRGPHCGMNRQSSVPPRRDRGAPSS
ncbi:MAG TPA: Ig-like domain-containing protein [Verrucomicrobiae bacterium]|nr:Ig-like domain-containing protein [Verrucomicrobiae bacterium]